MKYVFLIFTFIFNISVYGQVNNDIHDCQLDSINEKLIHTFADVMPEFEGGHIKLYEEITNNIKVNKKHSLGCTRITISFVIDIDGTIKNLCIPNEIEITSQFINSIDKWTPGQTAGVNVPVRILLPMNIKFK